MIKKCIQEQEHIEFSGQKLGSPHGIVHLFRRVVDWVLFLPKWEKSYFPW